MPAKSLPKKEEDTKPHQQPEASISCSTASKNCALCLCKSWQGTMTNYLGIFCKMAFIGSRQPRLAHADATRRRHVLDASDPMARPASNTAAIFSTRNLCT